MHYFDPTVDWPRDLLGKEIPDLLYLKSNDPLNLGIRLQFPNAAHQLPLNRPWLEYRSLDNAQSIAMLFIDTNQVERDPTAEHEVEVLISNLRRLHIEVGRYRKIKTLYTRDGSPIGSDAFIWSWAFRPLARHQLRPCLTTFETFSTTQPVCSAVRQSTTYRLLTKQEDRQQGPNAPVALILHHVDGSAEMAGQPRFSQELLYDHSLVEKTLLGLSPPAQFNDLSIPVSVWHSPPDMMPQAPM